MNKIYITCNGIRISPYRKGQCKQIENMTSINEKIGINYRKRKPFNGFLILDDESTINGTFITHLYPIPFLKGLFKDYIIRVEKINNSMKLNTPWGLNPNITPREVQYQIIQQIISNENRHSWFVYLSQGLGKTLLSVYLISYFNKKALIMCYNTDILKQWVKTIREKTNIEKSAITLIDSGKILNKIYEGTFPVKDYDIFMCTPKLLVTYGKKNGFEKLNIIMKNMGIGIKIFDEAHRNIANMIKINAYTNVNHTLYLSGDFGQSNSIKEKLYYEMFSGVPILRPTEELMNTLKFTVAVVVSYNSKPSELDKLSVYTKRGFSFYNYMKYQIEQKIFFDTLYFIMKSINNTNKNNYKILILVNLIEHTEIIKEKLNEKYSDLYIIDSYHSEISEEEKEFCRNNAEIIVSTYQSFSTGIDVELIKYIISCSICTKIDDNQSSGRARPLPDGSDAYYFILADFGFPYSKDKLGQRLRYLQDTKIKDIQHIKYTE